MNDWRRWLGISAVFLALCLPSAAASAGIIGVGFAVTGADTWGGRCGAACIYLDLSWTTRLCGLDRHFVASAPPAFTFSARLQATPAWLGSSLVGTAPGGGWQLEDGSGDSLYGSLSGWLTGTPGSPAGLGGFHFDVTGGTGLFAGVSSGSGSALSLFGPGGDFGDAGVLLLDPASPRARVPEPGMLALFAAALAALSWAGRRRVACRVRRSSAAL